MRNAEESQAENRRLRDYIAVLRNVAERHRALKRMVERFNRDQAVGEETKGSEFLRNHVVAFDAACKLIDEADSAAAREQLEERRPDAEALKAVPELKGQRAVVLYFASDEDRDHCVAAIQATIPNMRAVNL